MRELIVAAALAVTISPAVADPESDVRCRETAFSRSAENRDIEAFRTFLDDDARFVGGRVMRGPAEIEAAWQVVFTGGPEIKWRPQFVEVLEDGTLALKRGPFRTVSQSPEGAVVEQWGTFNSIWRLHADGAWRVVFDAGSPAATPPDEKTRTLLDAEDDCP